MSLDVPRYDPNDRRYIALKPRHSDMWQKAGDWCGGTRHLEEIAAEQAQTDSIPEARRSNPKGTP